MGIDKAAGELIVRTGVLSPHYQLELYKAGNMDAPRVHTEANPEAASAGDREAAGRIMAKAVRDMIGVSAEVIVHGPGGVARSEGKARRVADNRNA